MSTATITELHRSKIARHMYGIAALPKAYFMAFGSGGHIGTAPLEPSSTATALGNEVLRKQIGSIIMEDALSYTGACAIEAGELIGATISEAGILDEDGDLIGFRNFAPKTIDSEEEYEVKIRVRY